MIIDGTDEKNVFMIVQLLDLLPINRLSSAKAHNGGTSPDVCKGTQRSLTRNSSFSIASRPQASTLPLSKEVAVRVITHVKE